MAILSQTSEDAHGFTLVEILVSVAVIAILATVAYGSMSAMREKARDTERKTEIGQLQLALRLYKDAFGTYPTGHDSGTVIGEGGALDTLLEGYIPQTIADPEGSGSDGTYEYVYDTSFTCGGTSRIVLYAKTMERPGSENWGTVCGSLPSGGARTYGVVLQ
jgi:prepilin-type N-terminal cleavage/methylation domain-containing protein